MSGQTIDSSALLNADMTLTIKMPNGVTCTLSAPAAAELCDKLDAFGDDCSDACKRLRQDTRAALNKIGASNAGGEH